MDNDLLVYWYLVFCVRYLFLGKLEIKFKNTHHIYVTVLTYIFDFSWTICVYRLFAKTNLNNNVSIGSYFLFSKFFFKSINKFAGISKLLFLFVTHIFIVGPTIKSGPIWNPDYLSLDQIIFITNINNFS